MKPISTRKRLPDGTFAPEQPHFEQVPDKDKIITGMTNQQVALLSISVMQMQAELKALKEEVNKNDE